MAAARLVALALAWWLLATTLLCALARACRLPAALRAVQWATVPAVRRLVERSLVVSLSLPALAAGIPAGTGPASAAAATADAAANLFAPAVHRGTIVPPMARVASGADGPAGAPAPHLTGPTALTQPTPPTARARPARTHTVSQGEHLWGLAATVVAEATGRAPRDLRPAEVAAYWVRLIEANPSNLLSGDPDLVYPGEVVLLPPAGG